MIDNNVSDISAVNVLRRSLLMMAISALTILSMASVTSCSGTKTDSSDNNVETSAIETDSHDKKMSVKVPPQQSSGADKSQDNANNATGNGEEVTSIIDGKPVVYDINSWDTGNEASYSVDDLSKMQKVLGEVTSTDQNSLDFASNTAIKYRFMQGDDPFLDIIDSQQYLELGWYYANPNDTEEQKAMSIDHAHKAYELANHLMGEEGGELVRRMLTNQIIKNEVVGGQYIELAKCEFYSCMLIIKKQAA